MKRYERQTILPEFDKETQLKLKNARVLVVGAGALGSSCLTYLALAGIGTIGIVDGDKIELSNLHRQSLYTENDLGQMKAVVAAKRLATQNSEIKINAYPFYLNELNAKEISENYDIIVDGTDNFPLRYLINDLCVLSNKVNVHGSVLGFEGFVAVFNGLQTDNSRSANYRDLYPEPPASESVKNCAEAGVIGALPGIIGSMQALEVLKIAGNFGEPLYNCLFSINTINFNTKKLRFSKDEANPISGKDAHIKDLINYHEFCGVKASNMMKSKTVRELKEMLDTNANFELIDVREVQEYEEANLRGKLIPMGEIPERFNEIPTDKPVIVQCRSGKRSAGVIQYLETNHAYTNLYNLEGGILAWIDEIGAPLG